MTVPAPPFRRLLVPTDFGDAARRAADVATAMAREWGGSLLLVHVWSIPAVYTEGFSWPTEHLEEAAGAALDTELARVRASLPSAEALLLVGAAWEVILDAAKQHGVELIVMGTHGRKGLPRFVIGSVAERVVRMSPIPVLTVRAETA